jgi:tetratricopeptide (TPR) repeat protein
VGEFNLVRKKDVKVGVFLGSFFILVFLLFSTILFEAFAQGGIYLSEIIEGAIPDPAYKTDGYVTRRDVLPGVVGPETWVEHYIRDKDVIETLTYNNLIYGIIVKKGGGETEYYTLNDDRKTYSKSRGMAPQAWELSTPSYGDFLDKAKKHLSADRFKDAIEVLDEAIEDYGYKTAETYFFLAFSYDQLGEAEYAESYYREAIRLDPKNIDALYNLGMVLKNQERHSEAAVYLYRYLKLFPNAPDKESIGDYVNTYR